MTITVKQDNSVYILDEDNNFVCAHENNHIVDQDYYECDDCDAYANIVDSFYVGTDEWGYPELRKPEAHEWNI